MNTDEMILALVATGKLTLPRFVTYDYGERMPTKRYWKMGNDDLPSCLAHDLCAMHFARQMEADESLQSRKPFGLLHLLLGDSAKAIEAIYHKMKESK